VFSVHLTFLLSSSQICRLKWIRTISSTSKNTSHWWC
jgi:hypothetical protein